MSFVFEHEVRTIIKGVPEFCSICGDVLGDIFYLGDDEVCESCYNKGGQDGSDL